MVVTPISDREFRLYSMAQPDAELLDSFVISFSGKQGRGECIAAILEHIERADFSVLVLRRQTDHRLVLATRYDSIQTKEMAYEILATSIPTDPTPLSIPSGVRKRKPLISDRPDASEPFRLLTSTVEHFPALMTVGEIYLALPNPDQNFVSDFQTSNFNSRLWELYLFACFREQGIQVSQDYISPDFFIEKSGKSAFVEAVTANSHEPILESQRPTGPPKDKDDRLLGSSAERFAKSLRSKLQRHYETLPHVEGKPFALAIADFHAPGSMVWSRESLISYLYGIVPETIADKNGQSVIAREINSLKGKDSIPAGLFGNSDFELLSGVVFSNAATIAKFNRMGFLAGWRPPKLKMTRMGILYDRTPGALQPITFELDVLSEEYEQLWPFGEEWSIELEVFHNPFARYPISFELIPGATHWFKEDGQIVCLSPWEWTVLSSVTMLFVE